MDFIWCEGLFYRFYINIIIEYCLGNERNGTESLEINLDIFLIFWEVSFLTWIILRNLDY